MKKTLAAAAVLAALALTGCTAGNQSTDVTPSGNVAPSASASGTVEPTGLSASDIAEAKQDAIASGRPENAWDKNCIAWEWPEAESKGQAWANELGKEWLKLRNVGCPDAIVYPLYDITSFEAGGNGKLIVNYSGNPKWDGDGEYAADAIMEDLTYLGIAPKSVIVRYEANGLEVSNTK